MRLDTPTRRATARLLSAVLASAFASLARAADGPSFDCTHVTSKVNRMICASPELSQLDRLLADHYRVLLGQSGAEAPALRKEEQQWLREVRDPCPDAACIAQAYEVWDAVLVARSRRLASAGQGVATSPADVAPPAPAPAPRPLPAAPSPIPVSRPPVAVAGNAAPRPPVAVAPDPAPRAPVAAPSTPAAAAETRPFPVDPAILADARSLRGRACAPGEDVPRETGFVPVPGQLPVVSAGSVVLVRNHLDADFAVLLDTRRGVCRMVDVVALPPHLHVGHLLQCTLPSNDGSGAPLSAGVGLRRPGQQEPIAYWEIDLAHGQFIRQPLGVLDWAKKLACRQPEIGD